MQSKIELRRRFREIRKAAKRNIHSEANICDNILKSDIYLNCDTAYLYAFSGDEADIDRVIADALEKNKKVALPLCTDSEGHMEFYFITDFSDLESGMYSIREPRKDRCVKAESSSRDVCFVPGICFDKYGYRIGYGKGYYDRFLEGFDGLTVGVCFEECLCEALPCDINDKKVNYLITDKKIYVSSKEE